MEEAKPEGEMMMEEAPLMEGEKKSEMEENKEEPVVVENAALSTAKCIVWTIWAVIATFNIILLLAVTIYSGDHEGCSIPLYEWFTIEYTVSLLKYTLLLPIVCLMGVRSSAVVPYTLSVWLIISYGQVFWMIYGWKLYFSPLNDCYDHGEAETAGWLIWFIIVLWQGLSFMWLVLIASCAICCCASQLNEVVTKLLKGEVQGMSSLDPSALGGIAGAGAAEDMGEEKKEEEEEMMGDDAEKKEEEMAKAE